MPIRALGGATPRKKPNLGNQAIDHLNGERCARWSRTGGRDAPQTLLTQSVWVMKVKSARGSGPEPVPAGQGGNKSGVQPSLDSLQVRELGLRAVFVVRVHFRRKRKSGRGGGVSCKTLQSNYLSPRVTRQVERISQRFDRGGLGPVRHLPDTLLTR